MVDEQQIIAGLLDAARDAVPVLACHGVEVFRTMRASVPCQTSAFALILVSQMSITSFGKPLRL
jgi:hypothetical protein